MLGLFALAPPLGVRGGFEKSSFFGEKVLTREGVLLRITPADDALCQTEGRARTAWASAIGARGIIPGGDNGQVLESAQANYQGVIGEFAIHKWLGIPFPWGAWQNGKDAADRNGLDVARLIQAKFTSYPSGDFIIAVKHGELRAPYGVLVTAAAHRAWPGTGKLVVVRAWVDQARWKECRQVKDYGYGPARSVGQADMFDMADFPLHEFGWEEVEI